MYAARGTLSWWLESMGVVDGTGPLPANVALGTSSAEPDSWLRLPSGEPLRAADSLALRDAAYAFINQHPGVRVENRHADGDAVGVVRTDPHAMIPRLVHQTWKTFEAPEEWRGSSASWVVSSGQHPPLTRVLWTDSALRDFIAELFPWFLPTYDGYAYHIQRVDAVRYFILYAVGGVYADMDVSFRPATDAWDRLFRAELVLPATAPVGVSNDFLAATRAHPFLALLCRRLAVADVWLYSKFFTVMFSTGPSFVSVQLQSYALTRAARGRPTSWTGSEVWILPGRYYHSGPESLVGHVKGESWHSEDAKFLWWVFSSFPGVWALPGVILVVAAPIVIVVVCIVGLLGWSWRIRPARALLCCLYTSLGMSWCCGPPSRPLLCPCWPRVGPVTGGGRDPDDDFADEDEDGHHHEEDEEDDLSKSHRA